MEKTARRVLSEIAFRNLEKAAQPAADLSYKRLTRDLAAGEAELPDPSEPTPPPLPR